VLFFFVLFTKHLGHRNRTRNRWEYCGCSWPKARSQKIEREGLKLIRPLHPPVRLSLLPLRLPFAAEEVHKLCDIERNVVNTRRSVSDCFFGPPDLSIGAMHAAATRPDRCEMNNIATTLINEIRAKYCGNPFLWPQALYSR